MKIKICSLLLAAGFAITTSGQENHQKIPLGSLLKDFTILKFNLKNVHAGLYNYYSEKEFDSIFDTFESTLKDDLMPLEFYQKIGPLIKAIGDAHTEIEPPESFYDALNKEWPVFPISIKWLNNKLYVIKDFSNENLTLPGDEIVSINGVPSQEVFRNIRKYVPRDGKNLTGPNHTLSGIFGQFRNYYASLYGTPDTFRLQIIKRNGNAETITVAGLKYRAIFDKYDKESTNLKSKAAQKPLQFKIEDNIALLKVKSFHPGQIKEARQNFKKFFRRAFKQIARSETKKMIIDIRGNGGGHESVCIELFSYLTDTPFRAYRQLNTITNKIPDPECYVEQDEIAYLEQWANKKLTRKGNLFLVTDEIGVQYSTPQKPTFRGELLILIDGKTASAAGDFSGLVKKTRNSAVFIGEETGGNPYVNTAGTRLTLLLPNSGLQIIIPTLLYTIEKKTANNGHGILPDYPINLHIDDVLSKNDKVLEFARMLLRN